MCGTDIEMVVDGRQEGQFPKAWEEELLGHIHKKGPSPRTGEIQADITPVARTESGGDGGISHDQREIHHIPISIWLST